MPTFAAGQILRAGLLEAMCPLSAFKTADEGVSLSTVLQNDDELLIAGVATGTWKLSGTIWYTGTSAAAQDIKIAFAFPTGTFSWSGVGLQISWTSADGSRDIEASGFVNQTSSPTSTRSFGTVTSNTIPIHISGTLVNTAVGTLQLQWAQDTSNATATTIKIGSWLELRRMIIA